MDYNVDLLNKEINEMKDDINDVSNEQNVNKTFSKIYFILAFITPVLVTLNGNISLNLLLTNCLIYGLPILVISKVLNMTADKKIKQVENKKQYVKKIIQEKEQKIKSNNYTKEDYKKLKANILASSFYKTNKELVIESACNNKLFTLIKNNITTDTETILYICVEFRNLINNEKGKSLLKK